MMNTCTFSNFMCTLELIHIRFQSSPQTTPSDDSTCASDDEPAPSDPDVLLMSQAASILTEYVTNPDPSEPVIR